MKKLSLKAKMYIGIIAIALVAAAIFSIINFTTKDANRFEYSYNSTTQSYEITDIKNTFRGGIYAIKQITVPSTYKGKPVTVVKKIESAFIERIIISEGITTLGDQCFYDDTKLVDVSLPKSLTTIGNNAFNNCKLLTSITLPSGITKINDGVFENCSSLVSINLDNINSFGNKAFRNTGFSTFTVYDTITKLPDYCFDSCKNLTTVTLHDNITAIGSYALSNCPNLVISSLPTSVSSIGDNCFENDTAISTFTLDNSIKDIPTAFFKGCSGLTTCNFATDIESIGKQAFYGCSALNSIPNLSTSHVQIKDRAFLNSGLSKDDVALPELHEVSVQGALDALNGIGDTYATGYFKITGKVFSKKADKTTVYYMSVDENETESLVLDSKATVGEATEVYGYLVNIDGVATLQIYSIPTNAFGTAN